VNPKTIRLVLSLSLLSPLSLVGCASPGPTEVPVEAQRDLDELRDLLISGKREIQDTCNAARTLTQTSGTVPPASISKLLADVNQLESVRVKTWAAHARAQANAKEYFADWERKLQAMTGDVREQGQKRRAQSIASFDSLKQKGQELADVYNPFVNQLLECKRYLDTDSTSKGLQVVKPQLDDQIAKEPKLQQMLDDLIGHIEVMRGGK
jgi:hypothetical protein